MGVGDRHSKRAAAEKAKAQSSIQRAFEVDDRELDDAFSAWDEDDAGARRPGPAQMASAASTARTRVVRKPGQVSPGASAAPATPVPQAAAPQTAVPPAAAPQAASPRPVPGGALVDPVAMRDIVLSRARTVDDPLTTRVLAEIARTDATTEATSQRGQRGPLPQRARTPDHAVKVAPPRFLSASAATAAAATPPTASAPAAATSAPSGERTPTRSPDTLSVEPPTPASPHTQPSAPDEMSAPSRRATRRGIAPDEPARKK